MTVGSLDFVDGAAGVAGHDALVLAIDKQVKGFEDDGADQGGCPLGLNHGRKGKPADCSKS